MRSRAGRLLRNKAKAMWESPFEQQGVVGEGGEEKHKTNTTETIEEGVTLQNTLEFY